MATTGRKRQESCGNKTAKVAEVAELDALLRHGVCCGRQQVELVGEKRSRQMALAPCHHTRQPSPQYGEAFIAQPYRTDQHGEEPAYVVIAARRQIEERHTVQCKRRQRGKPNPVIIIAY